MKKMIYYLSDEGNTGRVSAVIPAENWQEFEQKARQVICEQLDADHAVLLWDSESFDPWLRIAGWDRMFIDINYMRDGEVECETLHVIRTHLHESKHKTQVV